MIQAKNKTLIKQSYSAEIKNMFLMFSEYLLKIATERETSLKRKDFEELLKIAVDNLSFVDSGSVLMSDEDGYFYYVAAYNHSYDILDKIRYSPEEVYMRRFKRVYVMKHRIVDLLKKLAAKLGEDEEVIIEKFKDKIESINNIKAFISIPIRYQRRIIGFFNLDTWNDEEIFEKTGFESVAEMIGDLLSIAVERFELVRTVKEKNVEIDRMRLFDSLTYLPNKKFLVNYFEKYCEISKRLSSKLYMICFDIKDLETINRVYGFEVGDEVLKKLSKTLSKSIRRSDVLARVGGDEFAVLSLSKEAPFAIQKRIEENLVQLSRKLGVELKLQMGIVEYGIDGKDFDSLLTKAQERAYKKVIEIKETTHTV
ncbi:sensor domain-containing diguanylate cyclase [Fervidobacterium gondwanense]|uniref:Diguanylate cyclase (GGDEF) domain-containing protein n=1 Tax=Fervidobacterium gondwanense DSM 13020 TaxID=1121883 RepID=A0A1M7SRV9_FERGO|nr:sensor domain-containing diguanylate cyclase [Fervidobacterium gondwanense]SHN61134.1 diguanylate cyclase (GGDEF) domain-containing protein [Fervidobacterium gondwanense DSM 13020]